MNLALQGGGSHGAYAWGVLDAFAGDARLDIVGISGASAGAINAAVYAAGLAEGGRDGARARLEQFWLSISTEGSLAPGQRKLLDAWLGPWGRVWPGTQWAVSWAEALSQFVSPYALNPLNVNPVRDHLVAAVDFDRLRATDDLKLFVAATNVRTGRGEIFRRNVLTADHVMASACLPTLFQAVRIDGDYYWDGGYAGNPPLWPLFYETTCRDAIIVQINPIERAEVPRTPEEIQNRLNEITFNSPPARRAARRRLRRPADPLRSSEKRGLPARAAAPHRRRRPTGALRRGDQVRRLLALPAGASRSRTGGRQGLAQGEFRRDRRREHARHRPRADARAEGAGQGRAGGGVRRPRLAPSKRFQSDRRPKLSHLSRRIFGLTTVSKRCIVIGS